MKFVPRQRSWLWSDSAKSKFAPSLLSDRLLAPGRCGGTWRQAAGLVPEFVFHHTHTHAPHYRAGERVKSYRAALDTASEDAKLPEGWHLHDLRHRRVTTWLAEGKSPVLVQKALGHADLRTTMGYYRYLKDHLRALVDSTPAWTGDMLGVSGA